MHRFDSGSRPSGFRFLIALMLVALTSAVAPILSGDGKGLESGGGGNSNPLATPEVDNPFPGDPRLEPLPDEPIHLGNISVFGENRELLMRFPPRVNGQNQSDGDKHADIFIFVYEHNGLAVPGQLPVIEAVPLNTTSEGNGELNARVFSAIWELHIVTVDPGYSPNEIRSTKDLHSSSEVVKLWQTNVFLNCPIVPAGSTVDPGSPDLEATWFQDEIVFIVPYDIQDGGFNPQVLFKFVDPDGNTLPSSTEPHLVSSFIPGQNFYSSIWEIWEIEVPAGFNVTTVKSATAAKSLGFPIRSSNIRLNCPVVAVETAPNSGEFEPIVFEDAFAMMLNDCSDGLCVFNPEGFQFDVLEGEAFTTEYDSFGRPISHGRTPSTLTNSRTFVITELEEFPEEPEGLSGLDAMIAANPSDDNERFPRITEDKGNVILLVLKNPFPVVDPLFPTVSGPNTTGELIRWSQEELEAAAKNGLLPPQLEKNFQDLIDAGILDAEWQPGIRSYQDRLALVGRALVEFVWAPELGAQQQDTTSCIACHSQPSHGASGRGLYTVIRPNEMPRLNPPAFWGGGAKQQQRIEAGADGSDDAIHAFGVQGHTGSIRVFMEGAARNHFGVRSPGVIIAEFNEGNPAAQLCDTNMSGDVSFFEAQACDPDLDGVVDELTEGMLTAMEVYGLDLPVPDEAVTRELLAMIGTDRDSIRRGEDHFRSPLEDEGGTGCTSCHTPFLPLDSTVLTITNPKTGNTMDVEIHYHSAKERDVDEGLAAYVGQPGMRGYTDFKRHDMGDDPLMHSSGTNVGATPPLWDAGSDFPYLRDGKGGSDLKRVILAHGGEAQEERDAFADLSDSEQTDVMNFLRAQMIQGKIGEGSGGQALPVFFSPSEICGEEFVLETDVEDTLTFPVTVEMSGSFRVELGVGAEDPDEEDEIIGLLPPGATMTPSLPVVGIGSATSVFSWTPGEGQHGEYLIIFTATNRSIPQGIPVECHVTVKVVEEDDLLAELASFEVKPGNSQIDLSWTTSLEIDNQGFYVWREEAIKGTKARVSGFIPAVAANNSGASYQFTDATAVNGVEYNYWLEDVDITGSATQHPGKRAIANPQAPRISLKQPAYGSKISVTELAVTFDGASAGANVLFSTDPTFTDPKQALTVPVAKADAIRLNADEAGRLGDIADSADGVVYWRIENETVTKAPSQTWRLHLDQDLKNAKSVRIDTGNKQTLDRTPVTGK